MACPTERHRCADQPWASNDSLTGVTAVSRSALARHAGSTATPKTLKPFEPILGFGGLRAITADCWVGTDSVFELGRRERHHNPNRHHRAPRRSDHWGLSLHPNAVFTTFGLSPLQSSSSHGPQSAPCLKQQIEDDRSLGFAPGYQRAWSAGSDPWSLAEFALSALVLMA